MGVHACVRMCVFVSPPPHPPIGSDSAETVAVIIVKLGTVIASGIIMHHVLLTFTFTFNQGHTCTALNFPLDAFGA